MAEGIFRDCCVVCNHCFKDEEPISVSRKGIVAIKFFNEKRGKLDLMKCLTKCISKTPMKKVFVYKKCRRDFIRMSREVSKAMKVHQMLEYCVLKGYVLKNPNLIGKMIACFV